MQSPLLLLLSSTKATKVTKVSSATKVTFILFLFSTTTRVTLTDDPGIPSVKYNLQLGDLTIKTELSTANNNSLGDEVESSVANSRHNIYRVYFFTGPAQKSSKYGTGPTQ